MPTKTPGTPKRTRTTNPTSAARGTGTRKRSTKASPMAGQAVSSEQRRQMIAELAYLKAEQGAFEGDPVVHWLAAENEVDARLAQG